MTSAPRTALLLSALALGACRSRAPETLYMLADRDVESVDPHASGGIFQTQNVLANVYEGLVARDRDMRLRPALALSWANPDDHTWDFTLREGVHFHDGAQVSADDVVASILRARDHPQSVVRGALADVAEVSAPAAGRVRLRTREPDAFLLTRLAEVYVIPAAAARAGADALLEKAAPGTGAYRLAAWRKGVAVGLERHESYWAGPAALRVVHVLPLTFGTTEANRQVPEGALATFYTVPGTPTFTRARQTHVLHQRPSVSIQYLGFDLRARESPGVRLPRGARGNPFRDARVREAIALAIDYEALRSDVFEGRARAATQMVAPEVLGFDPTLPEPHRDLEAARHALAGSAYPEGFEVDFDVRELVAQYLPHLVDSLGRLGIRARVRTFPEDQFFEHLRADRSSLYLLRFSCCERRPRTA